MFNKIKGVGSQIGSLATDAIDAVDEATAATMEQAQKLASATGEATSTVTEVAVRRSVRRLQSLVRIASEELQKNPPSKRPMQLVASFQVGMMSLELQVEIDGSESGAPPAAPEGEAVHDLPEDEPESAPK